MLKISAHRLEGSAGSQRSKSMPQHMQEEAAAAAGADAGRGGAGEMARLRIRSKQINPQKEALLLVFKDTYKSFSNTDAQTYTVAIYIHLQRKRSHSVFRFASPPASNFER
jgi:hypothetical protein